MFGNFQIKKKIYIVNLWREYLELHLSERQQFALYMVIYSICSECYVHVWRQTAMLSIPYVTFMLCYYRLIVMLCHLFYS